MLDHDSSLTPIFCCLLSFNNTNYLAVMQDISLGVALGSATQISMFVVRLKNPRQTKSFAKLTLERNHDNFFFFFFFLWASGPFVCCCCVDNEHPYGP
jgi:hypothetical protein